MANIIFCFSGTGNCLAAARDIAAALGDTKVALIADFADAERVGADYERVGIVCPSYYGNLPPMAGRFAARLDFGGRTPYVFAVITAGITVGKGFDALAAIIAERGARLNAGFKVLMPGNYLAMYGAFPAPLRRVMLNNVKKKAAAIAGAVKEKRANRSGRNVKSVKPLTETMTGYEKMALDYRVSAACTGCQTCVNICPARNITMTDGKPRFGARCERCMACLQWCPARALEYKDVTAKRERYHHPGITARDLFPNR